MTLPLLGPPIAAAASIVFLFTFTSFGVVLLLADPAHATLEVEIYRQAVELFDLPTAAALAFVQIVAVLAVLLVLARMQERRAVAQRLVAARDTARRPRGVERVVVAGVIGATSRVPRRAAAGARDPVVARRGALEARVVPGARLERVDRARCSSRRDTALRNSLEFALIATVIALVVGGLASVVIASRPGRATRSMDTLLMLPLGTSAVTVGFGFLVAFDRWPVDFRAKAILVPIAQAVVAIPFVIRAVVPALRASTRGCATRRRMLGAPPRQVWREVDLPITTRAFVVAAGFCGRGVARRVRRDVVRRPARHARRSRSRSQRFLARPGAAQRRAGAGDVDDPDGRDRPSSCSRSSTCTCAQLGEF